MEITLAHRLASAVRTLYTYRVGVKLAYERADIEFHQGITVLGKCCKYGTRTLSSPTRQEFVLQTSAQRKGSKPQFLFVRVTVYDPQGPGPSSMDYVQVFGLPSINQNTLALMAFGKDVQILNRWIPKNSTTVQI